MVYDNMRMAVKDFVGTDKTPTEALRQRGVHKVSADQIKVLMHTNNEPRDGNGENVPVAEHRQQSRQIEDAAMGILLDLTRMMDGTQALTKMDSLN